MVYVIGHHRKGTARRSGSYVDPHIRRHKKGSKRKEFKDVQRSIAKKLEGTKVPSKHRWKYGKRYSKSEAEQASKRIAGKQRWRR